MTHILLQPIGISSPCRNIINILLSAFSIVSSHKKEETAGLQKDFEQLMKTAEPTITRICFSFATDKDDFEDLRQDSLINIWRGLRNFRSDADIRTWIYRVTLNTCVSASRRRRKIAFVPIESITDIPYHDSRQDEEINNLRQLIGRLGDLDRSLILMQLDGLSYNEIADISGLNRNTVATRLHRVREKIKAMSVDQIKY